MINYKLLLIFVYLVIVTGCAKDLTREESRSLTTYELCKNMFRGRYTNNGMETAMKEVESRVTSCDKWQGVLAEEGANRRAGFAAAQQQSQSLINNSRVKQCFSTPIGDTVQTNCY